ncbi:RodZ domain-containing protein [Marinobacterium weihaiense]|uniref:DUF4115 domain-containing protein n=1 Tax=Marinobacterium weihaiense TaxID=2851016 RepID=A0ABS6MCP6_9GAMM|nr:RodZ domain-containing protein [Marinobacterium weihaiense]MBV0934078.1 DUF4115 domain-containing protein [Marinobacterium weihaiense]
MSEETPAVFEPLFQGALFTQARTGLELSLDQVARQLHLSEEVVRYIESGELDALGDPVFARGYVRAYARFLKLDADAMVAAYNQQTGNLMTTGQVRAIGTLSTTPGRRPGHPLLRIGSWLFGLVLVAACLWWWQAQYGFDESGRAAVDDLPVSVETTDGTTLVLPQLSVTDDESLAALTDDALAPLPAAEDVRLPEADAVVSEGPVDLPADEVSALETVSADAQPSTPAEEKARAEAAPVAGIEPALQLAFSDDCWLSVKDARGRTLYSGVAKGGSTLALEGAEPLALVIGRVSAVADIRYGGQSIDLAPLSNDNVARLRLPL